MKRHFVTFIRAPYNKAGPVRYCHFNIDERGTGVSFCKMPPELADLLRDLRPPDEWLVSRCPQCRNVRKMGGYFAPGETVTITCEFCVTQRVNGHNHRF